MGYASANLRYCMAPGHKQYPQTEAWLGALQHQPSSATSLSISLNPYNMLKKKEKLSFCLPESSRPVPLPPLPWDCSVPAPSTSRDLQPCNHLQGKPGPSSAVSQETLKPACQFRCKFILDATEGLQRRCARCCVLLLRLL